MTEKLLEQKLANMKPEDIVDPEMYVAVPALQALSCAIDSEELRELYANLLAKAMNTKDNVHPGLVETIKQMSPYDAAYFKLLTSIDNCLLVDIRGVKPNTNYNILQENRNLFSDGYDYQYMNLSISNLTRLGLINIPQGIYPAGKINEELYDKLIEQLKKRI